MTTICSRRRRCCCGGRGGRGGRGGGGGGGGRGGRGGGRGGTAALTDSNDTAVNVYINCVIIGFISNLNHYGHSCDFWKPSQEYQ